MFRILLISVALIAALAGVWWFAIRAPSGPAAGELRIETAALERRDLERVVASSGRIAPLVTVEVGSQLSGQIMALSADFNDQVSAGDILARIDPQSFETRVREAEAALEVAEAQVSVAQATIVRERAALAAAERAFQRAESLRERGTFSEAQYDGAQTAYENARAALAVANANLRNAQASLQQREANLNSARVDLERTYIRAPIDGVVIDRQIDEGQTVAASFNAPVLFLIAQDLARIQIEAQVDESDIGQIERGQTVAFDVDAYPGQTFSGDVVQVRLAAEDTQNVVTYTVVIEADNPGGRLLPGMTANVTIVTGRVEDALAAPNTALRFAPRGAAQALVAEDGATRPQARREGGGRRSEMLERITEELEMTETQREAVEAAMTQAFAGIRQQMQAGAGGPRPDVQALMRRALASALTDEQMARYDALRAERRDDRDIRRGQIWRETGAGRIQAQPVGLGLSDGQFTQVVADGLAEGDQVVVRVREID